MTNNKIPAHQMFLTTIYILISPTLLLFLAGDWTWVEGWIFDIWLVVLSFTTIIYLYFNDPELLAERQRMPGTANQKGWDKYVVYSIALGFITWLVIMPLDAKRFAWTVNFPISLKALGGIALLFSSFFLFRSFHDNTFLSPLVRIQKERKQKVVSTGVYGFVRHPMYLGGILFFIGAPMLLGSFYSILIGLAILLLLVGRIIGEEKMLVTELDGYNDYKKKVRYRLFPFIW